jgi:cyclopropane fatty-acyl-phospholipid synthase-like methyltransferase
LNPQPGERILDLGCGDGDYNLYRYVRRVTMPK